MIFFLNWAPELHLLHTQLYSLVANKHLHVTEVQGAFLPHDIDIQNYSFFCLNFNGTLFKDNECKLVPEVTIFGF